MEVSIAAISEQEIRNALETGWRDFEDALQYSDALLIEMEGLQEASCIFLMGGHAVQQFQ